MKKALINLICTFIPSKNLRVKIRNLFLHKDSMSEEKILQYFADNYHNEEVKKLGFGITSQAYLVGDILFKFQRKKYDYSVNKIEKNNCDFISERVDVEIPNITLHKDIKGLSYKILKGHVVKTLIDKSDVVKDVNVTLSSSADFLSQLHFIDLKEANGKIKRKCRLLSLKLEGVFLSLFFVKKYFSFKETFKIISMVFKSFFLKKDLSIIHNDFSFYNSLLDDDGKVSGIIDWAGAAIEERYWDLASFKVRLRNNKHFDIFINEYDKKIGKETDIKKINILALLKSLDLLYTVYSMKNDGRIRMQINFIKDLIKAY
ncbi:MAG: phosphotransferase [Alphaproteobacteria bacterium]|nr:phosphotransferase [Alphaproteobacteria bacterium]